MKSELFEGEDFYFDPSGLMVLTEHYHIKKGFCCGNGCRHCPYDYINVAPLERTRLLATRKNKQTNRPPEVS